MSRTFFNYDMIPSEFKEQFIIEIDVDEDEYESSYETKCEEHVIEIDEEYMEMARHINNIQEQEMFSIYIDWYVKSFEGTLEQPYQIIENDSILTAYNYYNYKNNNMHEMKLVFDEDQLGNVKTFLEQIGFIFGKNPFETEDKNDITKKLEKMSLLEKYPTMGNTDYPYVIYSTDGEEYYAYNVYNITKNRMSEMRIVFDGEQFESVKAMLKVGGFII